MKYLVLSFLAMGSLGGCEGLDRHIGAADDPGGRQHDDPQDHGGKAERDSKTANPCSKKGLAFIREHTAVSRPARGNIDEIDVRDPKSYGDVNVLGDQCRAVLGPIPEISCPDTPVVPVTAEGNEITYEDGRLLENGKPTDWRPEDGCDHPSIMARLLAPKTESQMGYGCLANARLGVQRNGPVTWSWSCHHVSGNHEKDGKFDGIGLIGHNRLTGESCFFSHTSFKDDPSTRTRAKDVMPPGGNHPSDPEERAEARRFWDPAFNPGCLNCHSSNQPWIVTPHIFETVNEDGSTNDLTPSRLTERSTSGKMRVIGVAHHVTYDETPKAIYPLRDDGSIDKTCTSCHVLPNQEAFLRMARLSVGLGDMAKYREKLETPAITPESWMPPGHDGSGFEAEKAGQAVRRYQEAFTSADKRADRNQDLFGPCPSPQKLSRKKLHVLRGQPGKGQNRLVWTYANDYGQVPLRDDIRFKITISSGSGETCSIEDVAPSELGSDRWTLTHLAAQDERYTYTLQPYRYCFDESGYEYGPKVHLN